MTFLDLSSFEYKFDIFLKMDRRHKKLEIPSFHLTTNMNFLTAHNFGPGVQKYEYEFDIFLKMAKWHKKLEISSFNLTRNMNFLTAHNFGPGHSGAETVFGGHNYHFSGPMDSNVTCSGTKCSFWY